MEHGNFLNELLSGDLKIQSDIWKAVAFLPNNDLKYLYLPSNPQF